MNSEVDQIIRFPFCSETPMSNQSRLKQFCLSKRFSELATAIALGRIFPSFIAEVPPPQRQAGAGKPLPGPCPDRSPNE